MEYIYRLPFILGALAAIIIGIASYRDGVNKEGIFLKMAICMTVFFIIGMIGRNVLLKTMDELEEKRRKEQKEEELRKKLEAERQEEQNAAAASASGTKAPTKIDLRAGPNEDELSPLIVEKVTTSGVNNAEG